MQREPILQELSGPAAPAHHRQSGRRPAAAARGTRGYALLQPDLHRLGAERGRPRIGPWPARRRPTPASRQRPLSPCLLFLAASSAASPSAGLQLPLPAGELLAQRLSSSLSMSLRARGNISFSSSPAWCSTRSFRTFAFAANSGSPPRPCRARGGPCRRRGAPPRPRSRAWCRPSGCRLAEGRIEDLLLDRRMDLQLGLDRLEQGLGVVAVLHRRLLELVEQLANGGVVRLQERDRVLRCLRLRGHGQAPSGERARRLFGLSRLSRSCCSSLWIGEQGAGHRRDRGRCGGRDPLRRRAGPSRSPITG